MIPQNDIEKTLQESRLEDQDTPKSLHEAWQQALNERQHRHPVPLLLKIKPWMWALASILVILLGVVLMLSVYKS